MSLMFEQKVEWEKLPILNWLNFYVHLNVNGRNACVENQLSFNGDSIRDQKSLSFDVN